MPPTPSSSAVQAPPVGLGPTLRNVGPGLIITAVVVGSGELIVTPKLGAEEGFKLLWFIVLGCLLKVFVQIEYGRYTLTRGRTTLAALNSLPGPRAIVSWVLWIWLAMYLSLVFQVAGMVGGTAEVIAAAGLPLPIPVLAVLVSASCVFLLVAGRYRLVERACLVMVVIFVVTTLGALVALQSGPYAMTAAQWKEGFSFEMPSRLTIAFATFGVIGIGASELIYYPYWCLEKGYARAVGPYDGTPEWESRARGWLRVMRVDAWISFVIYTASTLAFYILGAAILHAQQRTVGNTGLMETLSMIYRTTFGEGSFYLFLFGAFAVLYSTIFGATASNARLLVDALALFRLKRYTDEEQRIRWVKLSCVLLALAFTTVFLLAGAPVTLVLIGAAAQGVMLPFLAGAALYFHFSEPQRPLRAGPVAIAIVIIAAGLMSALGVYQIVEVAQQVRSLLLR